MELENNTAQVSVTMVTGQQSNSVYVYHMYTEFITENLMRGLEFIK